MNLEKRPVPGSEAGWGDVGREFPCPSTWGTVWGEAVGSGRARALDGHIPLAPLTPGQMIARSPNVSSPRAFA